MAVKFGRPTEVALLALLVFLLNDATYGQTLQGEGRFNRMKRDVGCPDKYQSITDGHSACLAPSSKLIARVEMNAADRAAIMAAHNKARREVKPTAARMMLQTWDEEIAMTAQRWADNCVFEHDKGYKRYAFGRFSVGQNLAYSTIKMTWTEAIQLWVDERDIFTYNGANSGSAVGHYTQIVWNTTLTVGCGLTECRNDAGTGSFFLYACNYGPAGNLNVNTPYTSGPTCAECPDRCNNGLCDCGGKVCYNGGQLDMKTCACKCLSDSTLYIQPTCGLNCTDVQDPSWCRRSFRKSSCEIYSNIPYTCPDMCGWCPTAAWDYTTVGSSGRISVHHSTVIALLALSKLWES